MKFSLFLGPCCGRWGETKALLFGRTAREVAARANGQTDRYAGLSEIPHASETDVGVAEILATDGRRPLRDADQAREQVRELDVRMCERRSATTTGGSPNLSRRAVHSVHPSPDGLLTSISIQSLHITTIKNCTHCRYIVYYMIRYDNHQVRLTTK